MLPAFRDNLSDPSSKIKQSKKNARAPRYAVYIANCVDGDWFLISFRNNE